MQGAGLRRVVLVVCLGVAGALAPPFALAVDKTFMGVAIEPDPGPYVVGKDVNVRAEPDTKSKKVGTLRRGERVYVSGAAKKDTGWLAVLKDAEPLGFVYGDMLLALIDGALSERITGEVETADGGTCSYRIKFDGKSPVEDDLFEVADYTVKFTCRGDEKALTFSTPMFLTEAPYRMGTKPEYQITLDIVEISDSYDEVFSSTSVYHGADKTVRFDGVSLTKFGAKPDEDNRPAKTIADALAGAVEMAVQAWNDKVWAALAREAQ